MKFGIRKPSLKRRLSARTSWKRAIRHRAGLKAPKGLGLITNPKKAMYNKVYNKTSISADRLLKRSKTISKKTSKSSFNFSFLLNTAIFFTLTSVFFPFGIAFLGYKIYINSKKRKVSADELITKFKIPEPTRSLLWTTDEDTSKITSPMTITITITLNPPDKEDSFYGEPSLIWSKLPIEPNKDLEEKAMYYPSYLGLSSKHRFQYLSWLTDITQETNLSYVFLYYYGLERHLLLGDYDKAVNEIIKLIKHHRKKGFTNYAVSSLISASAYRKRPDIVEKTSVVFEETTNGSLLLKRLAGMPLTAKEIIKISSKIGYSNKRYIKMHPKLFESELQKTLDKHEREHGAILQTIDTNKLDKIENISFANMSLPSNVETIKMPNLLGSDDLKVPLREILKETHQKIKQMKKEGKLL